MDIRKTSPKFLFTLAKNLINSENVTYEEVENKSFFESDQTTSYADKIRAFLSDRGLSMNNYQDQFFFTFIKENMSDIFDEEFDNNYSLLIIPELRTYKYIWDTRQVVTVNAEYEHEFSSYLDSDNAYDKVLNDRYNGDIYPSDGREISYNVVNSYIDEDSIEKFREI